jgi:uncharacterized protein YjiS (DUF1127 family)
MPIPGLYFAQIQDRYSHPGGAFASPISISKQDKMTHTDPRLSATRGATLPVVSDLFSHISAMFERARARRDREETRRQLHALSDRELADIGLTRHIIDDLV